MHVIKRFLLNVPGFEGLCRCLTRRHVRVFMYHRFRPDAGEGEGLGASVFREQLRLARSRHPIWTPEQQVRAREGTAAFAACPVVITTDDGYHDYYSVAWPILREVGVTAALFVTTGFVDGKLWLWWDKLRHLGEQMPPVAIELPVAGHDVHLDFTNPQGRREAVSFLINRGRFIDDAEKEAVLGRLADAGAVSLPEQPPASVRPLTWDQIREMRDQGQVFAPHTATHPILTRVAREQVDREIRESRDRLSAELGEGGRVFAYPQGGPEDFDADIADRLEDAGFAASYLAYQGPWLDDDAFRLPRYCATECMVSFRWALCGAEHLVNRLRRRLGLAIGPGVYYAFGSQPQPDPPRATGAKEVRGMGAD